MSSLERLQRHVIFFITGFKCVCVEGGWGENMFKIPQNYDLEQ